MSELISVGILAALALWGYGCHKVARVRDTKIAPESNVPRKASRRVSATWILLMCLLLLLSAEARMALGQTATSSVFPAKPTYVDAVTSIVTIPAVAGQPAVTGMIDYSVDGGSLATAVISTGDNYLNLGQLSIGSHVLTFQAHPGSPSASPIVPPHPVSIPVTDQTFSFVGVYGRFNSNYTDANLFSSAGLAIDSKDTVWIADSILSKLVSFDIFGNINEVAIASLPIPIANPAGLAFDSNDNLFISDRGNSRIVKYTPAGVETVLPIPGLGKPGQLMLDKTRNLLYIIDQDNERVVRYDLSAMALAGDPFSGLTAIQSIALDPAGNVYVSDNVARFLKNVNGVVSALPVNAPIAEAGGIYVDRAGLLYLTDSSINGTYRIDAQGHQTQISDFDSSHGMAEDSRGRIYFGTSTNVRVFTPAGELGTPAATKSMFSNSDQNNSLVYTMPHGQTALTQVVSPTPPFFYDIETESCPYIEIHGTCSFQVNFAPKVPGAHTGSIATTLPGGPTITTLLYGNATGPAPAFSPGTQTQTPSGAADSEGVALDEAGNYYVSDAGTNQVLKTSGGVTVPLGFSGLTRPTKLAVDGAGAVYVLDGDNRIVKLDLAGNQTAPVAAGTGNELTKINTFALDGGGQIYYVGADPVTGIYSIYLYDRTGATSQIVSDPLGFSSIALDPYGDIYALKYDQTLIRIDINGKQSTLAPKGTLAGDGAQALAVDASETVYVAVFGTAAITLVHPDGNTESIPVPALNHVGGIAINGTGSILAVDASTNNFIFVDRTHQDFNFGDVPVDTTKTFSASFGNAGTEPFQIETLPGDSDFQQVTTADACSTSGANSSIARASSCNLSYTVAPTAIGAITAYGGVSTNVSQDSDTSTENAVRVPVAPTFLPTSLSFGNVNVGATATQTLTLTLTNNDTAPLTLASISVTGSFSVGGASTCKQNGMVAVGGSCSFTVQFAPTAAGMATSTLAIQYTGGSATASLSGTGVAAPTATLTPASYDFGHVTVGKSSGPVDFQLTNTSAVSVTINDVSVTGSGFHLLGKAGTLAPGASATFQVAFLPTSTGAVTGTLSAVTSAGTLTTTLTGTGVAPTATLTPASYNFGNVTVGASSGAVNFQLTNTSGVSVTLSDVSLTGSGFHLLGKAGTLAPGTSTTFEAAYLPTTTGPVTGTLTAVTSAGTLTTTLTGTGVAPTATLTPASYDFGNVTVGATSTQLLLKFTNTGKTTLHPGNATSTLGGLQFPATAATTCTGSSGSTVVTLSPGGSCILAIDFAPTTAGTQTGIVSIPSEAGNTIATIVGTGVAPTATLTPATYNFDSVTVGSTSSQLVLRLTNTSNVPLHTTGALSSSPAFVLLRTATTCTDTTVLAPGGACDLPVDFSPTAVATVTGTISIGSEAGTETAALAGTGIAPTATLTPASYNFGDVTVGTTSGQVLLKFTNTSTGILHPGNATGTVRDLHFLNTASTTCTGSTGSAVVTLSPGASCILAIDFAPTTAGTQTGTVSIPSEAGVTSASIAGTGVAPSATLTPATYNFVSVTVGSASSQLVLKLTNTSSASLHLTGPLSSSPAFVLLETSAACTDTTVLSPGGTCDLPVDFSPTAVGTVTGTISIGGDAGTKTVVLTGTGVAPTPPPTVSPAALSFGNVTVGATSPAQIVALTNPATFPLTLTSIGLNGSGFSIQSAGTTCKTGPAIAAGASCTLSVIFSPAVAGAVSGSLTIGLPSGLAVSSLAIPLTGVGVANVVSPEDIDFTNGFTPNDLTLNGAAAVSGGVLQLTANQPSQASAAFYPAKVSTASFSTDFAFQLLDPLAEGITFTIQGNGPTAIGSIGGGLGYQGIAKSIALKFDLKDTDGEGVDSTGIYVDGAPPTVPATSLAASGIDLHSGDAFALHLSYDGTTESISLMDTSTGAVWTTQAAENIPSIVGGSHAYFGFTASTGATTATSASIKPAASTGVGTTANIIYWAYADRSDGVAALEPIQLNFGNVTVGSTSSIQSAELVNTGKAQFQVSSITPSDPSIVVHSSYCARPVTPGNYCKLAVTVAPTAYGAFTGSVAINYYLGDGPTPNQNFTSRLKITSTGITPGVTLTPASVDFGSVVDHSPAGPPKTFTVTNNSESAITLTRVTIADDSSLPFQIASGATCISGGQVAAGKSCTVPVVFAPMASAGATSGTLYASYLGTDGKAVTLASSLTGTGIAATVAPASINFGNVTVGSSASQVLTLNPSPYNNPAGYTILSISVSGPGFTYKPALGPDSPCFVSAPSSLELYNVGCSISVLFTPTATGPATGSVTFVTSVGTVVAPLSGTGIAPPADTPFISFGNGFTPDALTVSGFASIVSGALQLTSGSSSAASSAFYPTPVPTANFNTEFTFQLLDPTAEGITFTIQGDGPNAVGTGGGGLGYQGLAKSLAVKFDLKDTAGEGVDSTGIYVNGAAPTVPATSLASSGIDLHSGHIFALRLTYDGTTMTINLTDTVTGAVWTTQAAEDIPGITGGSTAYFGFTAGSGTPTLNSDAVEVKAALAVKRAAAAADATKAPATSNILSWIYVANGETKAAQTISFASLAAKTYGVAPITLAAKASSGLPVSYTVTGPATLTGSTLTITGVGEVTVTASQPGNASFAAAAPVVESFAVAKAPLTVTANSVSRAFGAANPTFTYEVSGFVVGDTVSVVSGTALLNTTAVSASPAGNYPITFSSEGLTAANYSFKYLPSILTITSASCQTVNYSSGFTASGLSLNGGAVIDGTALELTDEGLFEARSAFFSTALPTTSFTTDFTFQITNPVADGMTFVIQSTNPKVVGQSGGGLGYAGIPHSVAIKVDLHNNAGEGMDSTGTYVDGAFPSVPAIDLAPAGIDLHSGHIFAVRLVYANGLTKGTIKDTVTGVSASMNFPGDITQAVGKNAWFGFTAGTGAHSATQKILTWSYSGGPGCPIK